MTVREERGILVAVLARARNGRLIKYRREVGISQKTAAEISGVNINQWSSVERLDFRHISIEAVQKIAAALDCEPSDIYTPSLAGRNLGIERCLYRFGDPRVSATLHKSIPPPPLEEEIDYRFMVNKLLGVLSNRERMVLKMRYGIGGRQLTLSEVGKLFKITRERVRVIQNGAVSCLEKRFKRLGQKEVV